MFGGAFDPPHRAHRVLAQAAVQQLALDSLYVFPTGNAWHKERGLTPAQHRLAMARLAFAGLDGVEVDDRELRRSGPTYSIDTLRELQAAHPGAQLYLIMGEDQAAGFERWHAWQDIARMAVLCVAGRGSGDGLQALEALPGVRVHRLVLPPMAESATEIRARRAAQQDIIALVEPAVARYIETHHLYEDIG
ncbi:nicotinate (nicotinamide) nucleotide adenylyltransferase [Ramlibacter ginsenosidimutans]|uniref:Probable nicotinate-nucleotide adenylyltransferase n=2 Tax=Ramlibacter ginsenosidimutans TaxID=502333 RepID=A0A934TUY9_9BURK|nr:nicotinate (nicotinamide) nucleotide adenylyltransferase [Ramlibacter ginsenosidimutans]MBK6007868.1 nicotinate (nicotinamide) nucleotide adenylyltransferase [Ramlibacter ginsenosidimutans]